MIPIKKKNKGGVRGPYLRTALSGLALLPLLHMDCFSLGKVKYTTLKYVNNVVINDCYFEGSGT